MLRWSKQFLLLRVSNFGVESVRQISLVSETQYHIEEDVFHVYFYLFRFLIK